MLGLVNTVATNKWLYPKTTEFFAYFEQSKVLLELFFVLYCLSELFVGNVQSNANVFWDLPLKLSVTVAWCAWALFSLLCDVNLVYHGGSL